MSDPNWKQKFEEDGFLVVKGCVDSTELQKLKLAFEELVNKVDESELTAVFTTRPEQTKANSEDYFLTCSSKLFNFLICPGVEIKCVSFSKTKSSTRKLEN